MFDCRSKIQNMVVLLNGTFWSENVHCDICHEVLHVLSGRLVIECIDGRRFPLQNGDILLIPAGVKHRDVFNHGSDLKLQLVHFYMEKDIEFFEAVKMEKVHNLTPDTRSEINYLLGRIRNDMSEAAADMAVNDCRLNAILQLIWRELADNESSGSSPAAHRPTVTDLVRNPAKLGAAARHYVECNFCRAISLTAVAEHFKVSSCYLSHLFREENGKSFIAYLTDLRLREAERLLRDSGLSVSEISRQVGYENPNYFTRIFQRRHGFPPSDYREKSFIEARRNGEQ